MMVQHTIGQPLVIATDGSAPRSSRQRRSSWAWVDARGDYQAGVMRSGRSWQAELMAIHQAVLSHRGDAVLILTDCSEVLGILEDALGSGVLPDRCWSREFGRRSREAVEHLVREAGRRPLGFDWVRGHSGHPLNEAADRIARQARVASSLGQITSLLQRLAREGAEQFHEVVEPAVYNARVAGQLEPLAQLQWVHRRYQLVVGHGEGCRPEDGSGSPERAAAIDALLAAAQTAVAAGHPMQTVAGVCGVNAAYLSAWLAHQMDPGGIPRPATTPPSAA